ncbi:platelet glycoprotein V-like [Dendropsophus ebraccatus]|uniref:platelet glycoprotein V-like n=1 Tax=Dendropsophus ebraccatus TaxID=150705 RepID=UPI0038322D42
MFLFILLAMPSCVTFAIVCPVRCTCKVKDSVACQDAAVTDIATFKIPHNFTYVLVTGTQATELTESSFQHMPVTIRLFLQRNRFSILRPGAFENFPLLKTLRLSKNSMSSLSSGIFSTLVYLEHLYLDENVLLDLDPSIFSYLNGLEILNLSKNKLCTLPNNIFRSLSKLKRLILNDNLLVVIPYGMFDNLIELDELYLHSNLIEIIDNRAFYQLQKLKILTLNKNHLKTLADGLFLYLLKVETLSLYENPLTELPNVLFGKIDTLRSLRLWGTSFSTIPNFIFSNLSNLEVLVLTKNTKLQSLPEDAFSGLIKLVELYLYSNNISVLPVGLFQHLESLQVLSLYNNTFDSLPNDLLKPLTNLQNIYLNNSKISTLPGNLFKALPNLQRVHLEGNPWVCDCKIEAFKFWLKKNIEKVPNYTSLLCTNPPVLKAIPLLTFGALICQPTTILQEQKSGPYLHTTPLTSWDNTRDKMNSVFSTTEYFIGEGDYSVTEHASNWYNSKEPNHAETTTKHTLSGLEVHSKFAIIHICSFPSGHLIYYLLYFTTSVQIFLTIVQCFVLIKIQRCFNQFNVPTEPVVLLHVLVSQNCPSFDPNQ